MKKSIVKRRAKQMQQEGTEAGPRRYEPDWEAGTIGGLLKTVFLALESTTVQDEHAILCTLETAEERLKTLALHAGSEDLQVLMIADLVSTIGAAVTSDFGKVV